MKHYDLIQVLWVEDDSSIINQFKSDAYFSNLELVPYCCWDDAKEALENDYDRWSAIILDAKCKYHRDSTDNAVVFLREALKDISKMAQNRSIIPWYVLTGGDTNEVSDSINDERDEWDKDWTVSQNKKYYSKNTDTEMLYRRIREHARISPRLQIQKMYRNVFESIEEIKIDDKAYTALEDLLVPIHFPGEIDANNYNDKYQKARDVLEYVFQSMSSYGILPDWRWENNKKSRRNFTASSFLLTGSDFNDNQGKRKFVSKNAVLPKEFIGIVKLMATMIPQFCHADDKEDRNKLNKDEYLKYVDGSTYLLKSFTLQLCDLVLWYRNYLREHGDKEVNAMNWEVKPIEESK